MADECIDRGHAGALGGVALGREGAPAALVHAGPGGGFGGPASRMGCWGTSAARPAGCVPRRRVIRVLGGSRRSWAADVGTPTPCAISCAAMWLNTWPTRTPCWWLMKPG